MAGPGLDRGLRRSAFVVLAVIVVGVLLLAGVFALGRVTGQPQVVTVTATAQASVGESPQSAPLPIVGVEPVQHSVPLVFTAASDLSDEAGAAVGYELVDTDVDRVALARFLADVFGVVGDPKEFADGHVVLGSSAHVTVAADALVAWEVDLGPAPLVGKPMTADDARQAAQSLLAQLGVDPDEVDWQVATEDATTTVTAWETLGGRRTGLSWTLALAPRGRVVHASGFAGTLQPTRAYPLVGAASAVVRSNRPGWSAFGPSLVAAAVPGSAPTPSVSATSYGDRPLIVGDVRTLVITGAELGLAQHRQPDGALLIVPAYLLTADDGSTWTVLAVADSYTDLRQPLPSTAPTPTPTPTPSPEAS